MQDLDIEELLRRYRPAGPPAELRKRIVAGRPRRRARPWAAAAAALVLLAASSHVAATNEVARLGSGIGPGGDTRMIEDLTQRLGGDSQARLQVQLMLFEQDFQRMQAGSDNALGDYSR